MVEGGGDQISRIWGCKWKDISVELMKSHRVKCQSNIWIKDVLTDSRRHSKHTRTNRINDEKCRTNRFTTGWKGSRIKRGVKLFDQKYNDTFQSLYFRRKFLIHMKKKPKIVKKEGHGGSWTRKIRFVHRSALQLHDTMCACPYIWITATTQRKEFVSPAWTMTWNNRNRC